MRFITRRFICLIINIAFVARNDNLCSLFFSSDRETSYSDIYDIPWYGKCLHNEDQHVRGYRRDGQSYVYPGHREGGRSRERVRRSHYQRNGSCQTCEYIKFYDSSSIRGDSACESLEKDRISRILLHK